VRLTRIAFLLAASGMLVPGLPNPASPASLVGLGILPGAMDSEGFAVSADGRTVVGTNTLPSGSQAFRWTATEGMVGLGDLDGGVVSSGAFGVSGDGSVVVGVGSTATGTEAFRWESSTGMVALGGLPGHRRASVAFAISADGRTIVGSSDTTTGVEAFRWTAAEGMVGIGDLAGGNNESVARGVSADGSDIVGFSSSAASFAGATEMFRWNAATGMIGLGDIPGGALDSSGYAVSGDGRVVVGDGTSAIRFPEIMLHSPTYGIVSLEANGAAYAASADGSVVVGERRGPSSSTAFIWDAENGMRDLRTVLADLGVDVTDWSIFGARGISADGTTIVGTARTPAGRVEAFIAVIPEPGPTVLLGVGLVALAFFRTR